MNMFILFYVFYFRLFILGMAPLGGRTQLQCGNVIDGRYVTIYLNHTSVLNMCEIQIFGSKSYLVAILVEKYNCLKELLHLESRQNFETVTKYYCLL